LKSARLLNLYKLFHKLLHLHELEWSPLQKKSENSDRGKCKTQKSKLNNQKKKQNSIIKKAFLAHPFLKFSYPYTYTPELSLAF
jgi:hypothetical protein